MQATANPFLCMWPSLDVNSAITRTLDREAQGGSKTH